MKEKLNPYPAMIIDVASGILVPDIAHRIWLEGYNSGRNDSVADEKIPEAKR